mgnify:CR=1 FL=1
MVIDNAEGRRVRNWIRLGIEKTMNASKNAHGSASGFVSWDGKDDKGVDVPAGRYKVRGITTMGLVSVTVIKFAELPKVYITKNSDGSIKTKGTYTRNSEGQVTRFDVFNGQGKPLYSEVPYYAKDGRIIRADRLFPDGSLDKVFVYLANKAVIRGHRSRHSMSNPQPRRLAWPRTHGIAGTRKRVSLAYTRDSGWRNRSEFLSGRAEIVEFLTRKWNKELEYRLIKEVWAFHDNRIAVRFAYEWHGESGQWFRSYGNENWEFDEYGFMQRRIASINDIPINESDRKYHWPLGRRPDDHANLSELGL